MPSSPMTWQGPFDVEGFRAPRRGAFPALRPQGVYCIHLVHDDGRFVELT